MLTADSFYHQTSSGVKVEDSCMKVWEEVKKHSKYSYVIFRLSDDLEQIIVEDTSKVIGNDYCHEDECK